VLVVAFVFLYMFFGYYVAWQNPELRQYYGGHEWLLRLVRRKLDQLPLDICPGSVSRAALCRVYVPADSHAAGLTMGASDFHGVFPGGLDHGVVAQFFDAPSVARSHFRETPAFSLVFGSLLGWLLSAPRASPTRAQ